MCHVSGRQARTASRVDRHLESRFVLLYRYRIRARYGACDSNECVCDSVNRWRGLPLLSRSSHFWIHFRPILDGVCPIASTIAENRQSALAGVRNSGHEPEGDLVCVSMAAPVHGSCPPCSASVRYPNDLHCDRGWCRADVICLARERGSRSFRSSGSLRWLERALGAALVAFGVRLFLWRS